MRAVKLGRNWLTGGPLTLHWAVKVGDTWYEIEGASKSAKNGPNRITKSVGFAAKSGAGNLGGELAGETSKTDAQIDDWIDEWLDKNPCYEVTAENCQKFAYEFMDWLTDSNFICRHRFNAAVTKIDHDENGGHQINSFARAEDGNAIARVGSTESRESSGPFNISRRSIEFQAQAVAGPGLGLWADVSVARVEVAFGNVFGVHVEPNLTTGIGIRNGNVDVHLLGFGCRGGADGVEVNTPIGGVNACLLM